MSKLIVIEERNLDHVLFDIEYLMISDTLNMEDQYQQYKKDSRFRSFTDYLKINCGAVHAIIPTNVNVFIIRKGEL